VQENVVEDGEITKDTAEVNLVIEGKPYTIGVGDTKEITITGKTDPLTVRVMGFNHDKLSSGSAYGQTGITNVYAGISFEFVDFLGRDSMNGTSSSSSTWTNTGGWKASEMYNVVLGYKDEVDTAMTGSSANSYLKQVQKKYLANYQSATQSTSNDYLWLLAASEIWSKGARYNGSSWVLTNGAYGYAYATEGAQYKYYEINEKGGNGSYSTSNDKFEKPSTAAGDSTSNNGSYWWLRSPSAKNTTDFCSVSQNGISATYNSDCSWHIAPGFSI